MRRVRKVVTYVCTTCFRFFSSSKEAKTHAAGHPAPPRTPRVAATGRRGRTQTGAVLDAIKGGAKTAEAIARRTKLSLGRVHTILSYHRRRGNVKGFTG